MVGKSYNNTGSYPDRNDISLSPVTIKLRCEISITHSVPREEVLFLWTLVVCFSLTLKILKHEPSEMPGNAVLNVDRQGGISLLLLARSLPGKLLLL